MPLRPPVGGTLMAWSDRSEQDAWIARAGAQSGWTLEWGHLVLDRIRARGYVYGLGRELYEDLWASMRAAGTGAATGELAAKVDKLSENWSQETLEPDRQYEVGILTAPVFGADGSPIMQLSVLGLTSPMTGQEVEHAGRLLREATEAASAAVGARGPVPAG